MAEYLDSTKTSTVESTDDSGTYPYITPLTNKITKPESNPDSGQRKCNKNTNDSWTYKRKCPRPTYPRKRPFYHIGEIVYMIDRQNGAFHGPFKILSITRSQALLRHIKRGPTLRAHLNYLVKEN